MRKVWRRLPDSFFLLPLLVSLLASTTSQYCSDILEVVECHNDFERKDQWWNEDDNTNYCSYNYIIYYCISWL